MLVHIQTHTRALTTSRSCQQQQHGNPPPQVKSSYSYSTKGSGWLIKWIIHSSTQTNYVTMELLSRTTLIQVNHSAYRPQIRTLHYLLRLKGTLSSRGPTHRLHTNLNNADISTYLHRTHGNHIRSNSQGTNDRRRKRLICCGTYPKSTLLRPR